VSTLAAREDLETLLAELGRRFDQHLHQIARVEARTEPETDENPDGIGYAMRPAPEHT
jgi:hypothetical protein